MNIEQIVVRQRHRDLNEAKVNELAESIKSIGLMQPIGVTEDEVLVFGLHRLEACRKLGWADIPTVTIQLDALDSELAEIDENLIRSELTVLERADHLSRRKEIYEAKHPDARPENKRLQGLNTSAEIISALKSAPPTFAQDTAAKTGLTDRTIRQEVQISNSIPADIKQALRGTPLADNKTELLQVARAVKSSPDVVAEVRHSIANGVAPQMAVKEAIRAYGAPPARTADALAKETGLLVIGNDGRYHSDMTPRQREDIAQSQERRFQVFNALAGLASLAESPDEMADLIPDYQDFRVNDSLEKAYQWLSEFRRVWREKHGS